MKGSPRGSTHSGNAGPSRGAQRKSTAAGVNKAASPVGLSSVSSKAPARPSASPPPPSSQPLPATSATAPPVQSIHQSAFSDPMANSRVIHINAPQAKSFHGNSITTAKYTILSFVPAFLFEQFRRYSNIFFLIIALLQQIPDVSPTGRYTTLIPLLFILAVSALKEIIEDVKRHRADGNVNRREVEVLKDKKWQWVKWSSVCVGDFVKVERDTFFPADLILFSSSESQGICYIETSNLDGETNLKIRQSLPETAFFLEAQELAGLSGILECEPPNRNLYEFMGRLKFENEEDLPLGPDQILLRGAKLQNTAFIYGIVVYSGHDTKLMMNSTVAPLKRSTLDKRTNTQIIMLFILLLIVALTSATFSLFFINHSWYRNTFNMTAPLEPKEKAMDFLYTFLTFIILYNNLIPISLTVTLEVVRFIQALFINWDYDMYDHTTDTPAMARTSNLNEELGQVSYVFSDKTGTLTRNIMEFKACTIAGKKYLPEDLNEESNHLLHDLKNSKDSKDIWEFLLLLSVCHTVIPDYSNGQGLENVVYHAASPDERALVYGAMKLGFIFLKRTPNSVVISAMGQEEKYEIVDILEFSSSRKRMSVIVRGPDGRLKLYCKGADMMIYEKLKTSSSSNIEQVTMKHLEEFSNQGLRTLCCAVADVSVEAHQEWEKTFHKAATAIQDREKKLDEAAELIEKDLRLLGATAIEDKLQDEVPETIAALIEAKISVWVLTGDKQETAINIGYSCRLLNERMELLLVNRDDKNATQACIEEFLDWTTSVEPTKTSEEESGHQNASKSYTPLLNAAVIIDGKTLKFAMRPEQQKDFLKLCCKCRAVIVCRASPIQKAEIVELVTHETGAITLAIGDGANDVAMIQKAHVGIGISGVEGLQAACASDYAISQFRFLRKLLFVHGAWNYDRMCKLIFYSFYKNICLYIIELWFAIYSEWSGQIIFERWTIGLYNMFFTCAQPISIGLFERNCSQDLRMHYPILYQPPKNAFSLKRFFVWLADSILHSILIFWMSWFLYGDGIVWDSGLQGGYLVLGNIIYTYVVVVVSLKSGLITKSWTVFTHLSIWGSIVLWMIFLIVYSYVCGLGFESFGWDICGIGLLVLTSPVFWIGLIIVPIVTLLPDLIFKAIETSIHQGLDDAFRECEVLNKDIDSMIRNREAKQIKEDVGCLESIEDVYRACMTCDSFNLFAKYRCCCFRKHSKTSPHENALQTHGSSVQNVADTDSQHQEKYDSPASSASGSLKKSIFSESSDGKTISTTGGDKNKLFTSKRKHL